MSDRLDVGFVPAEVPGAAGSGAVETSTLLIERLSRRHDLTVYVSSQRDADGVDLPASDRANYVIHDGLAKLPHPIRRKHEALREELDAMDRHDLVHSYSSAFVPVLADLDVPTISTLNSYVPVCPKGDMMYRGERKCSGPRPSKCAGCIAATGLSRRQGLDRELRSAYVSLGKIDLVRSSRARAHDIDAYHALSPHMKTDYDALGFPGERITVIPHFYDESIVRDGAARNRGRKSLGGGPVTLAYVGALQDIKGVHVLIRALERLRARGHDAVLRVAGAGPYGDRLRALARECGVDDHVEWLGYVDHGEVADVYDSADVFVYPGLLDEPFGRVLLEALSTRTPLLASDVGSTDYIVGDAGELFTAGDPTALADAYERLIGDYDRRVDAIEDQLEQFAPETVEAAFSELYERVARREAIGGRAANSSDYASG
jgi:glycosyltransferase involved in cell wall biosynthesis